jgi:hypothetical protein
MDDHGGIVDEAAQRDLDLVELDAAAPQLALAIDAADKREAVGC